MSSTCYQKSSLETAPVYKECLKHIACKKFVTNAEKSSLESVFCICGCYNKDHRKVELPLHPTNPSSSMAAVVNTVLPPPPPPTQSPPQSRPILVYTRRNVSKATGVKKVEKKEKEERVVEMTEWTIGRGTKTSTRMRTAFSSVQKEKIREYAEKVKWRVLKKDDDKMIRLCGEIGITPDMCKNWITNNKKRHGQPPATFSL